MQVSHLKQPHEDASERELLAGLAEAIARRGSPAAGGPDRGEGRPGGVREEPEHVLHLLRSVLLVLVEAAGLAVRRVRELVHLSLCTPAVSGENGQAERRHTIVPDVISTTRAYSGRRLKLTMSASHSALRSSSFKRVSTTNRKTGGTWAGRASVCSMVFCVCG